MSRLEKEIKVMREDGKVFEVRDLEVKTRFLDSNYKIHQGSGELTPTGHLVILKLTQKTGRPPSFVGRWDGGSRDAGTSERYDLDFDMIGMPLDQVMNFKGGRGGYSGHHSKNFPVENGRGFEVLIKTPDGPMFEGVVSFTVHRRLGLSMSNFGCGRS